MVTVDKKRKKLRPIQDNEIGSMIRYVVLENPDLHRATELEVAQAITREFKVLCLSTDIQRYDALFYDPTEIE